MAANIEKRSQFSDFTVIQQLGSGSYGKVMKVQRKADNQFYAIKEVNIRKLQPREREDAVNEIRILASIKHKNIVRYCDAFVERDLLYIVMEFAEHGDISRQIEKFKKANKYIKEETVWSYMIQIAQALDAMHSRNVLHRDIKPKNVFLTGKNHIRLGDLGCAKLMKSGMARTQIGTPYYMSPEIWNNKPYDDKSDVWALGCLVFELAQLAPPFLANDMNGLAMKVKTAAAARISKHYSEDLANLVATMLSKDPRARPDLKGLLANPAVLAHMSCVPGDDDGAWAGEEMRQHMLSTIKVPMGFGYGQVRVGGPGGLALPAPSFPQAKPSVVDSDASRESAQVAAAAPVAASVPVAPAVEAKPNAAGQPAVPAAQAKPRPLSAQPNNQLPIAGGKPGQFAAPVAGGYKPAPIAPIIGGGIPSSRAALPGVAAIAAVNAAKGVPALGVRPSAAIGGVPLSGAVLPSRQPAPIVAGGLAGARPGYGGAGYGNPAVAAYLNRPAVPIARAGLVGGRGF